MSENPRPRVSQEIHHSELHANCLQLFCVRCRASGHTVENCWHVQHEVALIRRLTSAPPPPSQGRINTSLFHGTSDRPNILSQGKGKPTRRGSKGRAKRLERDRRAALGPGGGASSSPAPPSPPHPLSPRRPCGPPGRESSRSGGRAPPWWPQGVVSRPLPLPTLWRGRPPLAYAHPPPPPRGRSSLAEHRHPCWPVGSAFLAAGQPPSFHRDVLASLPF
ncbi:unnamed protein product [Penicillium salamii]|nr:unnamed protein product [Penicillium salamii]CAG8105148.1 unnamed protein product [Penicillium salamii]CAG8406680.1 unnamed protein product [Penicillium salamii]